jgi:rfaE bifunctional protein nucleotidyltransferase chain/domain
MKNIKKINEISEIIKKAKNRGLKVVTTNGTFDILHMGHVRNLEFAKSQGDILIVGVNSDASVRAYKGKDRPIVGELERAGMVASLKSVDYVFIFKEKDPVSWLRKLKPDIHVKGRDRKIGQIIERDVLKEIGAKFVFAPIVKGKSSTNIIEKIKKLK